MSVRTLKVERTTSTAHRLLEYEGACHNIHGHNFGWTIHVDVAMPEDSTNMALDLKRISDEVDSLDHTLVLNSEDPLCRGEDMGRVFTVEGDPTCEKLAKLMGEMVYALNKEIISVRVNLQETEKYTISATYTGQ